eukprot:scaffold1108_cov387-Prasinococcus_capsulatus_cf.AAC.10
MRASCTPTRDRAVVGRVARMLCSAGRPVGIHACIGRARTDSIRGSVNRLHSCRQTSPRLVMCVGVSVACTHRDSIMSCEFDVWYVDRDVSAQERIILHVRLKSCMDFRPTGQFAVEARLGRDRCGLETSPIDIYLQHPYYGAVVYYP